MSTSEQIAAWLTEPEGERIEFKSATGGYHFDKLIDYCVALANEGGGKIILGVTDRRPRTVVGTNAFVEPGRTAAGLLMDGPTPLFILDGSAVYGFYLPYPSGE